MIRRIISMTFMSAKPVVKAEHVHAGTGKGWYNAVHSGTENV